MASILNLRVCVALLQHAKVRNYLLRCPASATAHPQIHWYGQTRAIDWPNGFSYQRGGEIIEFASAALKKAPFALHFGQNLV
jgi:hypothetical protein